LKLYSRVFIALSGEPCTILGFEPTPFSHPAEPFDLPQTVRVRRFLLSDQKYIVDRFLEVELTEENPSKLEVLFEPPEGDITPEEPLVS
jgi:hypothetical protein